MGSKKVQQPELKLVDEDGNAYAILGRARRSFFRYHRELGTDRRVIPELWEKIFAEATSGDYDHLLQTMMRHFETS